MDRDGRSILHLAAQRGNVPVIEYIISAAKDSLVDQSDSRGRRALHYAVENKRAQATITLLVSRGADINAHGREGRSALHHAVKLGNLAAVQTLIQLQTVDGSDAANPLCMGLGEGLQQHCAKVISKQVAGKGRLEVERRPLATSLIQLPPSPSRFHVGHTLVVTLREPLTWTWRRCIGFPGGPITRCEWTKSSAITVALWTSFILLVVKWYCY